MHYNKRPLTIDEQLKKLKCRGLIFGDEALAKKYLSNISYYRLRAYTYPFQNNDDIKADHKFIKEDIQFSDIIDLYCFDCRLRNLIFNAIEKIEVAVRTQITQEYSTAFNDSHWFCNPEHYKDDLGRDHKTPAFEILMSEIENEVKRSNEDFIKHYYDTYTTPTLPPSWMTLEVLSLGTLSRLYQLLKKSEHKTKIAQILA